RVVVSPGDLSFDVLADGQRVDQTEPLVEDHVDAMEYDLAAFGDLHGVHLCANRTLTALTPANATAPVVDRDTASPTRGQRRFPTRHLGHRIDSPLPVGAFPEDSDAS